MLVPLLQCGVGIKEFWDLTFSEMNEIYKAHNDVLEAENMDKLYSNYNTAYDIVVLLGASLTGKPLPKFEEMYKVKKPHNKNEWIVIKEQLKQFAAGYNKQHSKG